MANDFKADTSLSKEEQMAANKKELEKRKAQTFVDNLENKHARLTDDLAKAKENLQKHLS